MISSPARNLRCDSVLDRDSDPARRALAGIPGPGRAATIATLPILPGTRRQLRTAGQARAGHWHSLSCSSASLFRFPAPSGGPGLKTSLTRQDTPVVRHWIPSRQETQARRRQGVPSRHTGPVVGERIEPPSALDSRETGFAAGRAFSARADASLVCADSRASPTEAGGSDVRTDEVPSHEPSLVWGRGRA